MKVDRSEVYSVLDGERDYQKVRWSECTTQSAGLHTVTEFMVFMQDYLNEAMHHVTRNNEPQASEYALNILRKVTAMGVACMEQHGAPRREGY